MAQRCILTVLELTEVLGSADLDPVFEWMTHGSITECFSIGIS